ncbi:pentatricopeptide repeat-containing protein At4g21065-like [Impatiens glandulifera]|uniref:pentatricopeptide repeat-containing protein At4g21065-like n=1 Tax=Impatiens glandulifera TaxID=253017 RepID=UPI001FB10EFF|nr:pentatricopeptide repeat-containing protein At4g21065-like [Impatiens glandulifera]
MLHLSRKLELCRHVNPSLLVPSFQFSFSIITNKRAAEQSCLSLLQDCNSTSKISQIHNRILKLGLHNNVLVLTKFTSTCSDLNAVDYATSFLFPPNADSSTYDAFLFNTIIRAYSQTGDSKTRSVYYFKLMLDCGILPNKFTFPFVLKACAGIGFMNLGLQVHGLVLKLGFDHDLHVGNTLIHMYCCVRDVEYACKVFDEMPKSDSVTWTAMISGYTRLGMSSDAVELFRKMQIFKIRPDEITMISVLSACTDLGALELGKWVESYIEKENIPRTVELCNASIDMFSKTGDINRAMKLFRGMSKRTIVSWTSMISGLANNGQGSEAISMFEEMKEAGIAPDDVAFIGILTACSHSGLVEEGRKWFDSIRNEYSFEPKIEHYGCMVDLFCRAGLIEEAEQFVKKMPFKPNSIILRTLITGCRVHGKFRLGESITKELIRIEPMQESNYVLLSSIYAKTMSWENKTLIREAMDKKGIRKVPGSTMIEIDNRIYEFVSGDKSHYESDEIYKMLDEMGREMKRAGYVSITSEVLLDIDDEDKEDALNRHGEKLAIAFALLKTPYGTPIRVVKNLRVCFDCHSAIKFISKVYNRQITMRDRNRFHHFTNGICSCKDFW